MMKRRIVNLALVGLVLGFSGVVNAAVNSVTPSTNDANRANGWAYVNQASMGVGTADFEFVSTRGFYSCFEYRTDGDTSQKLAEANYNATIADGLYPYVCTNNNTVSRTITAEEYVEVRMVFGAENDERFDWTRFEVLPVPFVRSAQITSPAEGQAVTGVVSFDAVLTDKDKNDSVQWAVRRGTCAAGVGTVLGNVDNHADAFTWDGADFHAAADVSGWTPGEYCFVFNPTESAGDASIRLTREFLVADLDLDDDGILNDIDACPDTEADTGSWDESWGTNRWQYMSDGTHEGWYQNRPGKKGVKAAAFGHDLAYTYGCSGQQILDRLTETLGEGAMNGHRKFGLSSGLLEEFHDDMSDGALDGRYLIEALDVFGNGATVESALVASEGVRYFLEASGTYRFANWGAYGIADAKYNFRDAGHNGGTAGWVDGGSWASPFTSYLQVRADGHAIDWAGDYNAEHLYTASLVGGGEPFSFNILDDAYGDNSGSIQVKIYAQM